MKNLNCGPWRELKIEVLHPGSSDLEGHENPIVRVDLMRLRLLQGMTALLVTSAVCQAGCSRPAATQAAPPPVPVTVAKAEARSVPFELRAIGTVEAYSTVAIKARVTGQVAQVLFREG